MDGLILRPMKFDDAKDAAAVCKKVFGKKNSPRRKTLADIAGSWRYEFWVAELDGKIVACMGAKLADDYADYLDYKEFADIRIVAVDPDYHGQGIGTKLFAKLIAELESQNFTEMYLQVHPSNTPAIEFYEHFGFRYFEAPGYFNRDELNAFMTRSSWTKKSPSEQ